MTATQRRTQIVELLRGRGYINANELSEMFLVDGSTIRRDLSILEKTGKIIRTHGGLLPAQDAASGDTPYNVRRNLNVQEKTAIALAALRDIEDGQSIILDNGSTVFQLAVALKARKNITVITNDLMTAMQLSQHPSITLHVAGGVMLNNVYTLVGPDTTRKFEHLHVDWAFLGAEGVHFQGGITNINTVEIPVKQSMIAAAERTVVLADSSKVGYQALSHVCALSAIERVITDNRRPIKNESKYGDKLLIVEA
ncbi:DeoR/GlpR family DNA-binding transcription regulator [Burkholderia guangdongensis]|uniref:DeoR/GlpR family DNA-binding transcription regulator n=1 Tax=Burkholderia guangdongensis TaxID=1792500 RepID=UPI0015C9AECE|nr:DeoR/GlpR family DNA-binding transcription regulator [Burkholderia guangdongensis]